MFLAAAKRVVAKVTYVIVLCHSSASGPHCYRVGVIFGVGHYHTIFPSVFTVSSVFA